jgi:hypothetical protein
MFCIQILVLEWNSELSEEALHGMIRIIIHIVIRGQGIDNDFSNRMTLVDTTSNQYYCMTGE